MDLAEGIGKRLAQAAIAAVVGRGAFALAVMGISAGSLAAAGATLGATIAFRG